MKVPILDLKAQYASIRGEVERKVLEIFDAQAFILGPEVEALEKELAAYSGVRHAVGVSSGTDGLIISLMALGIGPGDAVVTSPFSFFATAGAITRVGARPVFCDIDEATYNLDPGRLEKALQEAGRQGRVKAVMPVHLYGQCADMDPINELAARHGLIVYEDACQAVFGEYKGRLAGALSKAGGFSAQSRSR